MNKIVEAECILRFLNAKIEHLSKNLGDRKREARTNPHDNQHIDLGEIKERINALSQQRSIIEKFLEVETEEFISKINN